MSDQVAFLQHHTHLLDLECRRLRAGLAVSLFLTLAVGVWGAHPWAQQSGQSIRVRELIIEDADGRARMLFAAPMSDGSRRVGLRINDANGAERLGMSLQPNGSMVLGFDAPPGTGDNRNRERITIVADQNGGAHLRFLDRRTSVPASMYLDEQNAVWLEFSDFMQQPPLRRRIGLRGDEAIR